MNRHPPGRGRADGKQKRPKQEKPLQTVRSVRLPIVGEVPLVQRDSGTWGYDPAFKPVLPPGAVAGDISRQVYCCGPPRFAYIDVRRVCVQCGGDFVFGATEQKYWYEVLQFRLDSRAVRCVACRRQRRSNKAVAARYQAATRPNDTDDPNELIEFAEALVEMLVRTGSGKPDDVIAAARKAHRANENWADPLYWEGRGHELAGRDARAAATFGAFVDAVRHQPGTRRLVADAKRRLST